MQVLSTMIWAPLAVRCLTQTMVVFASRCEAFLPTTALPMLPICLDTI